ATVAWVGVDVETPECVAAPRQGERAAPQPRAARRGRDHARPRDANVVLRARAGAAAARVPVVREIEAALPGARRRSGAARARGAGTELIRRAARAARAALLGIR